MTDALREAARVAVDLAQPEIDGDTCVPGYWLPKETIGMLSAALDDKPEPTARPEYDLMTAMGEQRKRLEDVELAIQELSGLITRLLRENDQSQGFDSDGPDRSAKMVWGQPRYPWRCPDCGSVLDVDTDTMKLSDPGQHNAHCVNCSWHGLVWERGAWIDEELNQEGFDSDGPDRPARD